MKRKAGDEEDPVIGEDCGAEAPAKKARTAEASDVGPSGDSVYAIPTQTDQHCLPQTCERSAAQPSEGNGEEHTQPQQHAHTVLQEQMEKDEEEPPLQPPEEDLHELEITLPPEQTREEADEYKRDRMKAILARLTVEQMERYECYRRSALQRASVKRLMQSMVNTTITQPMTIVMAGITKLFVGDIVENAKQVMSEWNETGPLRPAHVREAFRRVSAEGKLPQRQRPALFRP